MTNRAFFLQVFLLVILTLIAAGLMFHIVPTESRELFSTILGAIIYALRVELTGDTTIPIPKSIAINQGEPPK